MLLTDVVVETTTMIPRIKWVRAGIALCIANADGDTSGCATLLLEELITGRFQKFINNTSGKPHPFPSISREQDFPIYEFLAFTQHLQWEKTNQMAFISDYQGSNHLVF